MIAAVFFDVLWPAFKLSAGLWVYFLAVMHLRDAIEDGKVKSRKVLYAAYCVLAFAYLLDMCFQWTLAFLLFRELPPTTADRPWIELTFSARVKRLASSADGWRRDRAIWYRDHVLSPFDRSGRHG